MAQRQQATGNEEANSEWRIANSVKPERVGIMASVRSFKELVAWQKAMELAETTYRLTALFPNSELFGLTQQARRAASAVAANIAEGWGRRDRADYLRFLRIARGSLFELQTHMALAERLKFVETQPAAAFALQADECCRVLQGLAVGLERKHETNA
jgi:four helix bundle protein